MNNKIIIISVIVAILFLGFSFAVIGLTDSREPLTRTEFIDAEPMKNRFLDWINQNRAEKNLSAINMDAKLSEIAYKEALRIANANSTEYAEIVSQDENDVVKSYGYGCVGNDNNPATVRGVAFASEHTRYPGELEPFVKYYMNQVVSESESYGIIFSPDASKIGMGIAMSAEKFYVLQYVCGLENKEEEIDWSKITLMEPNSMEFFYYPNPEDTENRDVFQKFVLIRLSEHLGGDANDVSAFRAYSAVSISTDHCVTKYWPDGGRQRLEDPCWGTVYRAIDGLIIQNTDPVLITSPMALPYLDLSMDENGSLYIEPPVWTVEKNGVVGYGRSMSAQEIHQGSKAIADSVKKSHPNHPSIPVSFAGYGLAEVDASHNKIESRYYDYSSMGHHSVYLDIANVSAQDQKYFLNLAKHDSETWQIGDTLISVGGNAFDENNTSQDPSQGYVIQFLLDGFKYRVSGANLELLKKSIVANFFPEYSYDDMFLVSVTEK
ncbi:hypothetical protein C6990_09520 [Nitrosopumilus sp. b3]|uniref:CAP domain-containing protein n=1 Tax=Nitrosopumilus sp. b3 TaxID=2109909 RepID=UPI0015F4ABF2|nr:CAP domain-containing protein [Nitrosopumilus sp. b3]KAF6246356.1 hypothetical protein C6990_09520 [Nitrosopumilus sp. b3]